MFGREVLIIYWGREGEKFAVQGLDCGGVG